jgi:hypothetical protein
MRFIAEWPAQIKPGGMSSRTTGKIECVVVSQGLESNRAAARHRPLFSLILGRKCSNRRSSLLSLRERKKPITQREKYTSEHCLTTTAVRRILRL